MGGSFREYRQIPLSGLAYLPSLAIRANPLPRLRGRVTPRCPPCLKSKDKPFDGNCKPFGGKSFEFYHSAKIDNSGERRALIAGSELGDQSLVPYKHGIGSPQPRPQPRLGRVSARCLVYKERARVRLFRAIVNPSYVRQGDAFLRHISPAADNSTSKHCKP